MGSVQRIKHEQFRSSPYEQNTSKKTAHWHCRQLDPPVFATGFHDILPHGKFPRKKYNSRDKNEICSTLHRGQRKLLMSEIGALIRLDPKRKYLAVYAGAAPGIHTPLLSKLFPNITFHLFDPVPFQIEESDMIKLFNIYFTDEIADKYRKQALENLVFICDIRRTNDEHMVWEDMVAQKRWHEIMQPILTSLKFRLPWPNCGIVDENNQISYLMGDIHLPVWAPRNSTESRLVIEKGKHNGERIYDCLAYEEEMCFFNRYIRPSIHAWQNNFQGGLDGCYDCTAEITLLEKYNKIWTHIALTSKTITEILRRSIDQ